MTRFVAIVLVAAAIAGCGSSQRTYTHTADEEKAMQEVKNLTPEQQIERAQNAPISPEAKETLIRSIKEKNGLK